VGEGVDESEGLLEVDVLQAVGVREQFAVAAHYLMSLPRQTHKMQLHAILLASVVIRSCSSLFGMVSLMSRAMSALMYSQASSAS
jgi:hypothetical protein